MGGSKLIVAAVSIFLVVGVCVGVIIVVTTHKSSSGSHGNLSASAKSVASICEPTIYKEACVNSLKSVYNNNASATPTDFIKAAIDVTLQEVKAALNHSGIIGQGAKASIDKMAFEDCKELLQYAIHQLQASFSMVGDPAMHTVSDREAELRNWLSAVVSYQETCMDGIENPDLKGQMTKGLLNATQLTSNALSIVSEISKLLDAFQLPLNNTLGSQRHLLESTDVDANGYPSWLPAGDRKLLAAGNSQITPNAVVAQDGTGQYKTIAAALAAYPKNLRGRYIIYVKAGIYNEYIQVTEAQINVFMYGDGPRKTMITGRKSNREGVSTYQTASFAAIGRGFIAKSMGFQNTAGPEGHQAVALRSQSDMSAFYNCRMDGYQDTLYAQSLRQFYRNCVISGTVDFIFGDSTTLIQNSLIIVRKPMDNQQNTVTAHGRKDRSETTGLVIQNCRIVPEQKLFPTRIKIPTYLGRPWKQYSRTVIMESTLGDFIQPAGWMPWSGNFALDTLYYAEYANRGPGANTNNRVKWKGYKVITNRNEAVQFTAGPFLQGNLWLRYTGIPYFLGMKN